MVFHYKIVGGEHFEFGSSVLSLCGSELLAAVNYWPQASFTRRTLPLVQDTRNGDNASVSVQHKLSLGIRLRERSRLDQGFLDFIECGLLFRTPCEGGIQSSDGMQGCNQLSVPRDEFAIVIGESEEALHLRLVTGNFPIAQLDDGFRVGLHSFCGNYSSQVLDFRFHEIAFGPAHFETGFTEALRRLHVGVPYGPPQSLWQSRYHQCRP